MEQRDYIFDDSRDREELERLRAIEAVFDPATQKQLGATGIRLGWRCLEVGPGAGSIVRWMSDVVGDTGQVVAVDINPRFLADFGAPNIRIVNSDIRTAALEKSSFDLAHARYVLIHIQDSKIAFETMLEYLKPGGWIVVEEPDFSAARPVSGNERDRQATNRVNKAIERMFASRGMDYALGLRLPSLFQQHGLRQIAVENDAPLVQGGSGVARMMKMSAMNLREKYVATGEATQGDIEHYCHLAEDSTSWAVYYSTVRVMARK